MSQVLIIDTYSLFFRAFHALPHMNTQSGEPTSAVYGFSSLLLKLLREHGPLRGLSFALDAPARTFRHERFAGYKAHRDRMPSVLAAQLGRLDELIECFGAPTFCVPGYEADDVVATLCRELAASDTPALVVSGDRDLLQLATTARVLFVGARGKKPVVYDAAAVTARFGVPPERLPSLTALVGDTSDNLPGVPGIGPTTASKLVAEYGDVNTLLAHAEQVKTVRVREALTARAAQILEVEGLARLDPHVPLAATSFYAPITDESIGRLRRLFEELEFRSLLERLDRVPLS